MIKIADKTLTDLEFPTVCAQISEFCVTQMGIEKALTLKPYTTWKKTVFELDQTNEYLSSYQQESRIPNHGFDSVHQEIKLLGIEETILETASFKKISSLSESANTQIKFFNKYQELYPCLYET